jgi:hypothetical protein
LGERRSFRALKVGEGDGEFVAFDDLDEGGFLGGGVGIQEKGGEAKSERQSERGG